MEQVLKLKPRNTALEFFSGIGLARAGMAKAGIRTVWANDIDKVKCQLYRKQWGNDDLVEADVFSIDPDTLPTADIAWASSPCTDLSLAGKREGLRYGKESSAFFGFIDAIEGTGGRKPSAIVLENVCGLPRPMMETISARLSGSSTDSDTPSTHSSWTRGDGFRNLDRGCSSSACRHLTGAASWTPRFAQGSFHGFTPISASKRT